MAVKMIDPPEGYRFGFPKAIPEDVKDVDMWLIFNGYPNHLVIKYARQFSYVPCRYFYAEDENE